MVFSTLTRDRTQALGGWSFSHWPPGKSQVAAFYFQKKKKLQMTFWSPESPPPETTTSPLNVCPSKNVVTRAGASVWLPEGPRSPVSSLGRKDARGQVFPRVPLCSLLSERAVGLCQFCRSKVVEYRQLLYNSA